MPRRSILTERQRSALFDLPTDEADLLKHYILADDDIQHIHSRRKSQNRLGFALQLCALRFPGRMLAPGRISYLLENTSGENRGIHPCDTILPLRHWAFKSHSPRENSFRKAASDRAKPSSVNTTDLALLTGS